jgi:hypothetical protein
MDLLHYQSVVPTARFPPVSCASASRGDRQHRQPDPIAPVATNSVRLCLLTSGSLARNTLWQAVGITPKEIRTKEDGKLEKDAPEYADHRSSFGHGIHAGIHWRGDTEVSMLLGQANAISILQDQAQTFHGKFTVHFTKPAGTPATLANQ